MEFWESRKWRFGTWFVTVVIAFSVSAAPAIGQTVSTPAQVSPQTAYVLGSGDVVEISVLGTDSYNIKAEVQQDGSITLPFLGAIRAQGMTALQLRDDIAARLNAGGYFARPAVNLSILSHVSSNVTVLGQVRAPGMVTLDRPYRLSEVVARVGGVNDAAIDTITLTRANGESSKVSLRMIATGDPANDPFVVDGDKVFVAPPETFYIYGQVNAPGSYPLMPDMTIRMALARGGGLTALASKKKVKLIRENRVIKARLSDPILPGDVIDVGERFF